MDKKEELKQRMLKLAFYRHPEDEDVIYLRLGALCEEVNEYAQQVSRDKAINFRIWLHKNNWANFGRKVLNKLYDKWINQQEESDE